MLRWLLPAALTLGACAVCPVDEVTDKRFAPVAQFHDDLIACANHDACNQLCIDVFAIDRENLESCRIQTLIVDGAWVVATYRVPETCAADDSGDDTIIVGDDGGDDGGYDCTYDDSCDPPPPDDPCDDGSCDPPPDDGGDTGDDTGGDDGGDDGSWLKRAPTSPRSSPAPRLST